MKFRGKIIYRDLNKEGEILSSLRGLGFEASGDKFYLLLFVLYIILATSTALNLLY